MAEPPAGDEEDAALLSRSQAGDRDAFGALVERHLRRAHRVALALVGDHEVALDLTQDALVRTFEARARLDPARPFFPFLYQVPRRRCFTWLRDERGRARRLTGCGRGWPPSTGPWSFASRCSRRARVQTSSGAGPSRSRPRRAADRHPDAARGERADPGLPVPRRAGGRAPPRAAYRRERAALWAAVTAVLLGISMTYLAIFMPIHALQRALQSE